MASRENKNPPSPAPIWLARCCNPHQIKNMKRWAILTTVLYALALTLLAAPAVLAAFGGWAKNSTTLTESLKIYLSWGYWLWLAVLVAGQFLLLLLPISLAERRQPARRPVKTPILVSAFFLSNLALAGIVSILCAVFKEGGLAVFGYLIPLTSNPDNPDGWQSIVSVIVTVFAFWLVWAIIFRSATKSDTPDALLQRSTRWLLRGSILELLVAIPSHIVVRRREDCCAPIGTFWGIVTGVSVMLLCFGPGVFFLFVERCRRLQPKEKTDEGPANP